jgi:hypothetical protein
MQFKLCGFKVDLFNFETGGINTYHCLLKDYAL